MPAEHSRVSPALSILAKIVLLLNQSHFIARLPTGQGPYRFVTTRVNDPASAASSRRTNVRLSGTGDDARLTMLVG